MYPCSMIYNYDETVIYIPLAFFFSALNAFYSLASGVNYVANVKRLKLFPLHSFWMAPLYLGYTYILDKVGMLLWLTLTPANWEDII